MSSDQPSSELAHPDAIAEEVEARLAELGDELSAAKQQKYMKSAMRFHGVPNEVLHAEARRVAKDHAVADRPRLLAVADALWSDTWWDLRSVSISLLDRKRALLGPADLELLVERCRGAACWAHVDELATHVIGDVLRRHPEDKARLPEWGRDPESFWIRRVALLAQLRELRKGEGDFALFEAIAEPLLEEKEFFIRKAIGWVLRDVSKKHPEPVRAFVERHGERMSGLSRREASKYL